MSTTNAPILSQIGMSENDFDTIAALGGYCMQNNDIDGALTIFEGLTVGAPGYYGGWAGSGSVALASGHLELAEKQLRRAVSLPNGNTDPAVLANLGETLLRLGKLEEGVASLARMAELDPNAENPATHRARAVLKEMWDAEQSANQQGASA